MMQSLTPPPERDLPAWRVAELRTRVMAAVQRPAPKAGRVRRAALVAAIVAAVVAGGVTTTTMTRGDDASQFLAFGPGMLSPELSSVVDRCLAYDWPKAEPSSQPYDPPLSVTKDDLVVSAQHGESRAAAFVTDVGYLMCQQDEKGSGWASERWQPQRKEWLPGPAERLLLMSTESAGGDVTVIGRVSAGVHRLVLDYGNGHSSDARFGSGMFALLSDGTPVTSDATLISYDANGREIGRSVLFESRDDDMCFTDPAGTVIYGKAGNDCRPAFHWR